MALKPTIYKFNVDLADIDNDVYDGFSVTLAQHPSETLERMMVRWLAYCLTLYKEHEKHEGYAEDDAHEGLEFTRGLSADDEPDLWQRSLDGVIVKWIEVGEPSLERLRKANRAADSVAVYSFNTKSDVWWRQLCSPVTDMGVRVFKLNWSEITALANLVERTQHFSLTVTGLSAFVATQAGTAEINWVELTQL